MAHDWPGNVRELENVLERAMVLAEIDVIGPEHLPEGLRVTPDSGGTPVPAGEAGGAEAAEGTAELVSLDELDRRHVFRVLAATDGNREASARILGISRRTLTRMIQRWGWRPGAR
jgi:DNA-binding NtrC family response regulator